MRLCALRLMSLSIFSSSGTLPCLLDNVPYVTSSCFTVVDPNDPDQKPLHDVHGANVDEALKAVESAAAAYLGEETTILS